MNRTFFFALIASALIVSSCSEPNGDGDAGPEGDSGMAGHDAGSTGHDAGSHDSGTTGEDAGPTGCTTGCAFVQLAVGSDHTCARRENGEVWCWGRNKEGQLGDDRMHHQDCGLDGDGMPVDCSSIPVEVVDDTGAMLDDALDASSEGALSTCAIRESGELWCWGYEGIARVNGDMPELRFTAERVDDFGMMSGVSDGWVHACMIHGSDDDVVCYGYNDSGELGVGDRFEIRIPNATRPVLGVGGTGTLSGIEQVVAAGSGEFTCARSADTVYCWGTNRNGELGDGVSTHGMDCGSMTGTTYDCSNTPVVAGATDAPLTNVGQLALGTTHACALGTGDAAGTVWCWGDNRAGALAQPDTMSTANLPTEITGLGEVAEIAAGGSTTCARLTDGTVWCWGFNDQGQLGDGVTSHENCTFGTASGDCSHTPVQVMGLDDASHIRVGSSHACAIRESGQIWCWGYNANRQLGDGTRDRAYAPVRVLGLPD